MVQNLVQVLLGVSDGHPLQNPGSVVSVLEAGSDILTLGFDG